MRFMDVALAAEAVVIITVILTVPYTEIDWKAYMEEVEGFLAGELDYRNLKGGTGPLVYPGGFVWVYSVLYYLTKKGEAIELAQWIYAGVYLVTLTIILRLYTRSGLTWKTMIPLFVSKRIRSLYVLRLFNDCWAMLFLFAAVSFIAGRPSGAAKRSRQWFIGCLCYSIAVSIKMNVLLFAPGMLYVMLRTLPFGRVAWYLLVCAAWQVAAGLPFLAYDYRAYLSKSFELDRVFLQRWSVNYQFLNAEIFVKPEFGQALLAMTVATWVLLWRTRWAARTYLTDAEAQVLHPAISDTRRQNTPLRRGTADGDETMDDEAQEQAVYAATLLTFFEANLVGVIFARSIHYQFYTWFFYMVPFVLAYTTFPRVLRLVSFALIRQGFESFPPTPKTSMMLQGGFALTLFAFLFLGREARPAATREEAHPTRDNEPKLPQTQGTADATGGEKIR
ncbi:putative dolichyl-P-Man:GDP-Man5GlcNAc2-PP-dolichyl alpha-1,3-mannosyltransferase [Leishmania major strain Friedlin]|uniref:dolichyl-P-Man:Man5GlcNAc2-PP-dolichol alpha-1,3-mannosyltransferase n=1 Tax=Leishmania major TaxID=5664 RepID=Q4Q1L8_LEIMA|nr:putative dolichyl-P-Man:GDP-Man5GlcNAc2-PP-dolichyl alpha-1,3-mannosyltransferase [Leishmania major strain Friedlin]CAG9583731.1 dolichyl-P-Man:GDP-Man5GlcNAc2-PP-dolichyl_alpha-1_-3-mannosyltransferase_-_putative [Leishmania major strain Friedlin]CAJ09161.1 putative dolichyl-P-Man:GDP-Man5GlcNAc2-PP-dolichyl alpha-1,3-mannosyltransferase [Leishmania major strain Friedlin]|eukprot:XP_001686780.1 putative dolichyl-P-Man:GDP-Man5GlcNAc2-PP-dolichyl alpha-1,3-mannosyltransferase [Leishmania major strain Friedlin]